MTELKNIKYIDAHAHVHFDDYDSDRSEVIDRASDEKVGMINVGTTLETSRLAIECEKKFGQNSTHTKPSFIRTIIGIHPIYASEEMKNENWLTDLENLIKENLAQPIDSATSMSNESQSTFIGIGEIGIDVFRIKDEEKIKTELALQERCFRAQIDLAIKYDLPIMIHARDSYHHILPILQEYFITHGAKLRGDAHFFAGSIEEAQAFLDLGFNLSFTGVITFADEYASLVKFTPIDRILIETDCPYVTPVPFRGKRNEPIHVREILAKIASIKGISEEDARVQILENTKKLFKLS